MSNGLEKDMIGEHEGWLNNPLLTFFLGLVLLSLFSLLGNAFHVGARGLSPDVLDRKARFAKIKEWRNNTSNQVDLEGISIVKWIEVETAEKDPNEPGKKTKVKQPIYQIPLSEAKKLLVKEHNAEAK